MTVLIDTNALLAYYYSKDVNHTAARQTMRSLNGSMRLVPAPVLTELFFVSTARVGYERAVRIDAEVRKYFNIVPLAFEDMLRMEAIMNRYLDAEFDYADTAIMALAERLKISRVFTFDRRDFTVFRPALTLLP